MELPQLGFTNEVDNFPQGSHDHIVCSVLLLPVRLLIFLKVMPL